MRIYKPPPTLRAFMLSDALVRVVVGPVGSGKSSGCVMDLFKHACEQAPAKDGIRRTAWAIIRNTHRELKDTTRKTFSHWIDDSMGVWSETNFTFMMRVRLPDGTSVQSDFLFRALDRPQDAKKLLSLEITGAYANECRELPRSIMDALKTRIGRYPPKEQGGPSWRGIIADTNPTHVHHWLRDYVKIEGHAVFRQPSGRSPQAENIENLDDGYYERLIAGMDENWIKVNVDGEDEAQVAGSIYGDLLTPNPPSTFDFEEDEIFVTFDVGRSDATAMWFWKLDEEDPTRPLKFVDYYENTLKPLSHYIDVVNSRGYKIVRVWLPHDAKARTLASELSIEDQLRKAWPGKVQITPNLSLLDGLAAARWLLEGRCRFHSNTAEGYALLHSYRRKYDADLQVYSQTPLHDHSSNCADSFRYVAVVVQATIVITKANEVKPPPPPEELTLDGLYAQREQLLASQADDESDW